MFVIDIEMIPLFFLKVRIFDLNNPEYRSPERCYYKMLLTKKMLLCNTNIIKDTSSDDK